MTPAASDEDKIDGIIEQTRGDIGQGNVSDVADALRQRLADADITVSDDEFEGLLARLS
jgi:hypothetical protein